MKIRAFNCFNNLKIKIGWEIGEINSLYYMFGGQAFRYVNFEFGKCTGVTDPVAD